MPDLAVDLYGEHLGMLVEDRRSFDFEAAVTAVTRWGVGSDILSFAVPLTMHPRRDDAAVRRNFFDEVLPEGRARARLAGNAKLAPDYTIGMLARYGRDVAGALKIWDPDEAGDPRTPDLLIVDDSRIRDMLAEVATAPLGNATIRRMSSLAGIQDKIVIARIGDDWAEPLDGYASTHIIKPVMPDYPTLIFDEEYGARIARHVGLSAFSTDVQVFDGVSALVIERFDRSPDAPDRRIHQEDFNQALGMSGEGKYESEGHPGLAAIARILATFDPRAVEGLLRMTALSLAIGNLDMHAKNIAVLHHPDGTPELAPMYDVVPQLHQPFPPDLALFINGRERHGDVRLDDLVAEGRSWGVRDAERIVTGTVQSVHDTVRTESPHPGAQPGLASGIERIASRLLDGETGTIDSRPRDGRGPRPPAQSPGGWGGPSRR